MAWEQKKHLFGKRSLDFCNKMKKQKSKENIEKLVNAHKKPIVMFGILYESQKEFIDKFSKSRSHTFLCCDTGFIIFTTSSILTFLTSSA